MTVATAVAMAIAVTLFLRDLLGNLLRDLVTLLLGHLLANLLRNLDWDLDGDILTLLPGNKIPNDGNIFEYVNMLVKLESCLGTWWHLSLGIFWGT